MILVANIIFHACVASLMSLGIFFFRKYIIIKAYNKKKLL